MKNLIDTWLDAEAKSGLSQAEAIRLMNKTLDCRYTSSRINEWRRGIRVPDSSAHRYMLVHSLLHAMMETDRDILLKLSDPADFAWRLAIKLGLP